MASNRKPKQATCHCCGKPATTVSGKPNRAAICGPCICQGGAIGRRCAEYPHGSRIPKQRKREKQVA